MTINKEMKKLDLENKFLRPFKAKTVKIGFIATDNLRTEQPAQSKEWKPCGYVAVIEQRKQ
jgi:hypothetical protein